MGKLSYTIDKKTTRLIAEADSSHADKIRSLGGKKLKGKDGFWTLPNDAKKNLMNIFERKIKKIKKIKML